MRTKTSKKRDAKPLFVRVSEEEREVVKRFAELEGRSMSSQVRQFIRECVARRQIGDSR